MKISVITIAAMNKAVVVWLLLVAVVVFLPLPEMVTAQNGKIVGGKPAAKGEFPAFAHPVFDSCSGGCGGTLIWPDIVMSAAHCQGVWTDAGKVGIGMTDLCGSDATQIIDVVEEYNHPLFDDSTALNDIALIKLKSASTVTPALWNTNNAVPVDNALVEACGFGQTENGNTDVLLKVTMRSVNVDECDRIYEALGADFGREIMCAGAEEKDTCYGDSGGPLFLKDTPTVVGITSFGMGCGEAPGGFTRVSTYDPWIKKTICAISDVAPTTFTCDFCGDGRCDDNEDCISCPGDCGGTCPSGNDGICEEVESCSTSPRDCGPCSTQPASCPAGISETMLALNTIGGSISYDLTVPTGDSVSCQITGGTGDADLQITLGDYTCESKESGNMESCATPGATAGATTALVEVVAFEPYANVGLTCTCADFVPRCGDTFCTDTETCSSCPLDCGKCPPTCATGGIAETGLSADFDILSFTMAVMAGESFECRVAGIDLSGDEFFEMAVSEGGITDDFLCYSFSMDEPCSSGIFTEAVVANVYLYGSFADASLTCSCGGGGAPTPSPSVGPPFPFNIPILGTILDFLLFCF